MNDHPSNRSDREEQPGGDAPASETAGGHRPKSLISSWAQNQDADKKPESGHQPKSLIAAWSQKEGLPEIKKADPALPPQLKQAHEHAVPDTPAHQKRMLWEGEHTPPPPHSSQQLVKDAASALRMNKPQSS
jgi:hypothetical protein